MSVLLYVSMFKVNVLAMSPSAEPARIRDVEKMVVGGLAVVWALTIPYFMFVVGAIGFQLMMSLGDETKQASLKTRGGNFVLSFVMVFGGYLVVKLVMSLLGFKNPGATDCFGPPVTNPFFQIFFPEICTGTP